MLRAFATSFGNRQKHHFPQTASPALPPPVRVVAARSRFWPPQASVRCRQGIFLERLATGARCMSLRPYRETPQLKRGASQPWCEASHLKRGAAQAYREASQLKRAASRFERWPSQLRCFGYVIR